MANTSSQTVQAPGLVRSAEAQLILSQLSTFSGWMPASMMPR